MSNKNYRFIKCGNLARTVYLGPETESQRQMTSTDKMFHALADEVQRLQKILKEAECSAQHIMQLRADTGHGDGSVEHLPAKSYTELAHDLFIKLNVAMSLNQ